MFNSGKFDVNVFYVILTLPIYRHQYRAQRHHAIFISCLKLLSFFSVFRTFCKFLNVDSTYVQTTEKLIIGEIFSISYVELSFVSQ